MSVGKHHKAFKAKKAKKAVKRVKAVKRSVIKVSSKLIKRRPIIKRKIMDINVNSATYDGEYALLISFSDGLQKRVDFSPFIESIQTSYLKNIKTSTSLKISK